VTTRAVRFHTPGPPEVMQIDEVDLPDPGAHEVRIRQTAIGLNFQDVYQRSGFYPLPLPSGVGTEAAGVVEQCGSAVTGLTAGDRVCYVGGPIGSYADRRNVPADRILRIPDGVSDEQAAAGMLKGLTVEYLLNRTFPLRAGQYALMYAAAGGVGSIAGQWGKAIGATMIGVVSGPEKAARAHRAAADELARELDAARERLGVVAAAHADAAARASASELRLEVGARVVAAFKATAVRVKASR